MEEKIVVILGPTATHKSEIALYLARRFPFEIVSCDSMQFYRGMDIGTAKVPKEVRLEIPHHFIDIIDITEEYSIAEYKKEFYIIKESIYKNGHIPLIVGGSGLYIRSITENFPVEHSSGKDEKLREELSHYPIEKLRELALSIDEASTLKVGKNDRKRLIRIIEYYMLTKKKMSEIQNPKPPFKFLKIGTTIERKSLYEEINKRVDTMVKLGLIEEVKYLKEHFPTWSKTARQAIGYKEILDYLNGLTDLETAINLIKQHTRNFAKRQITWFKKESDVHWVDTSDVKKAQIEIERLVGEFLNED